MTNAQFQGLARHGLQVIGDLAMTVGIFSGHWGHLLQAVAVGGGAIVTGIATIWSVLSPEKGVMTPVGN